MGARFADRFLPGDARTIAIVAAAFGAFNVTASVVLQAEGHPIASAPLSFMWALRSVFFSVLFVVFLAALQTERRALTARSAVAAWIVTAVPGAILFAWDGNAIHSAVLLLGTAGASLWLFARRKPGDA